MVSGESELERFRRDLAAMLELLDELDDKPTGAEAVRALGEVRAFMHGDRSRSALTPLLRRAAADLYYLEGYTQPQIGKLTGVTKAAVSTSILGRRGEVSEYVAVRRGGGGEHELRRVPVRPDEGGASYKLLRQMREEGWRVAPAVLQVDPESVDAAKLWERLGKMGTQT